jgi:hypothetical protein
VLDREDVVADLEVNSADLVETGTALRFLADELRKAERIVQDNKAAMGHPELAEQLDRMQGTWDDRRNALVDDIATLGKIAKKAGKTFEEIEEHLVAALEGREE